MNQTLKLSYFFIISLIFLSVRRNPQAQLGGLLAGFNNPASNTTGSGCEDNETCTKFCGLAGAGECVNKKYCKCADCPGRSVYELATLPKICTIDPLCACPEPVLPTSLTDPNGRIYFGHRCLDAVSIIKMKPKFVCICFCLPTSPGAFNPFHRNSTT